MNIQSVLLLLGVLAAAAFALCACKKSRAKESSRCTGCCASCHRCKH